MDNDRATVDKGSLPVSMVHKKKQPGIAVYYQAKKAKVGRPKQVEKIVYRNTSPNKSKEILMKMSLATLWRS